MNLDDMTDDEILEFVYTAGPDTYTGGQGETNMLLLRAIQAILKKLHYNDEGDYRGG